MARIRSIKPEFPQSESMGRVSRESRLCFVLLWTLADDEGRLRGNSRMLASLLFPYDDDAPSLIDGWLQELEGENCIVRYQVEGTNYLEVSKWLIHQKIDKPSKSKIPPPDQGSRILANPRESSWLDQGSRIKDQGSKEVDQGGGGEGEDADSLREPERAPIVKPEPPVFPELKTDDPPEKPVKPKAKASGNVTVADLMAMGVNEQHAKDWIKARGAPLTLTALNGMKREVAKAGIELPLAVQICAEKGWRGFNASWYWQAAAANISPPSGGCMPRIDPQEASRQRERQLARRMLGIDTDDAGFIDAETREISA